MTLNRRHLALAGLVLLSAATQAWAQNLPRVKFTTTPVSYTHLTLPTNREV